MTTMVAEIGGQGCAKYNNSTPSKFKVRSNRGVLLWVVVVLVVGLVKPAVGQTQFRKQARPPLGYYGRAIEIGFAVDPLERGNNKIEYRLVFRRIPERAGPRQLVFTKHVDESNWRGTLYEFKRTGVELDRLSDHASDAEIKRLLHQESLVDIQRVVLLDENMRKLADSFAALHVPLVLDSGVTNNEKFADKHGLQSARVRGYLIHRTIHEFWYESPQDSIYIQLGGTGRHLGGEWHPLVRWIDDAFALVKQSQKSTEGNQQ